MSNLIEQIIAMEEGRGGDAIIFQPKSAGGNGSPNYGSAQGIIRRFRTAGGYQWSFHTLQNMMGRPVTGSGQYGDINDAVKAAERQFGHVNTAMEWVATEYTDPDYPPNLIPM